MARPSSKDPFDRFRWSVSIEGFTRFGFTACDVPSYSITTRKYAEGGDHLHPRQIVDSIEYRPVTLSRGVTFDSSFSDWAIQVFELARGSVENPNTILQDTSLVNTDIPGLAGTRIGAVGLDVPVEYRRDVIIDHLNREGNVVKTYKLYAAFPIEYTPASSFSADGDDEISIERITLIYESFQVISNVQNNNPLDIRNISKKLIKSKLGE